MVAIVLERLVNVIVLVSQQKQFPEHNFSYFSEKMHHVVRSRRICVNYHQPQVTSSPFPDGWNDFSL